MNPRYVFECGQIKVNIFSAASEESAWKMLEEKIELANKMDIILPNKKEFKITQKNLSLK